jgi:hypothetical protein
MNKDVVRCVVVGHSNGPECPLCKNYMDTAKVTEKKSNLCGFIVGYCYSCLRELPNESEICLLKSC